jgi:hypothetical protein
MCRGWARVVAAAVCLLSWRVAAAGKAEEGMTAIEFEEALAAMRREHYRHPKVDIIKEGFRPVGGKVADFAVAERAGRYHFFYIERRLVEGTPFYPGHETYFGHASTANFVDWEVHEPVLMVRPGTWEGAHVWAPCIVRRGDEYVMAYTGVNKVISQDIGIASSLDLFEWKRWASNPVSPCKGAGWAYWRTDGIASCRDPSLCAWDGRYWMIYTANTKEVVHRAGEYGGFRQVAGSWADLRGPGAGVRGAAGGRASAGEPGVGESRAARRAVVPAGQGEGARQHDAELDHRERSGGCVRFWEASRVLARGVRDRGGEGSGKSVAAGDVLRWADPVRRDGLVRGRARGTVRGERGSVEGVAMRQAERTLRGSACSYARGRA